MAAGLLKRPSGARGVLKKPSAALKKPSAAPPVKKQSSFVTVLGKRYPLPPNWTPKLAKQKIMIELNTKDCDSVFVPQTRILIRLPCLYATFFVIENAFDIQFS